MNISNPVATAKQGGVNFHPKWRRSYNNTMYTVCYLDTFLYYTTLILQSLNPSWLNSIKLSDSGQYKYRVDYHLEQTFLMLINLIIIINPEKPSMTPKKLNQIDFTWQNQLVTLFCEIKGRQNRLLTHNSSKTSKYNDVIVNNMLLFKHFTVVGLQFSG